MTTELILLLAIYAFIVIGVFLGDGGPIDTFKQSAPRLAARVERNVSIGHQFKNGNTGENMTWMSPGGQGQ